MKATINGVVVECTVAEFRSLIDQPTEPVQPTQPVQPVQPVQPAEPSTPRSSAKLWLPEHKTTLREQLGELAGDLARDAATVFEILTDNLNRLFPDAHRTVAAVKIQATNMKLWTPEKRRSAPVVARNNKRAPARHWIPEQNGTLHTLAKTYIPQYVVRRDAMKRIAQHISRLYPDRPRSTGGVEAQCRILGIIEPNAEHSATMKYVRSFVGKGKTS